MVSVQTRLGSGIAVAVVEAGTCSSYLTLSLGNSYATCVALKGKKKKKERGGGRERKKEGKREKERKAETAR